MNLYRAELEGAILRYEAANAPTNSHRTADIAALRVHLNNIDLSPEELREKINECFAKFRTGLKLFNTWLHETHKSKLGDELNAVLKDPRFNKDAFSQANRIDELEKRDYKFLRLLDKYGIDPEEADEFEYEYEFRSTEQRSRPQFFSSSRSDEDNFAKNDENLSDESSVSPSSYRSFSAKSWEQ